MDCERIERDDIAERYLSGRIDPAEIEEFEAHYFGCPLCLERLRAARLVLANLWEGGGNIPARAAKPVHSGIRRRAWAFSAVAAALFVIAGLWWRFAGPGGPPSGARDAPASLSLLARFDPPSYILLAPRGAEDKAAERFRRGMERYGEGRYDEAIPELRAATEVNPRSSGARFFLGICLLLTWKTDAGIEALGETASLGESAFLEEAHFYRAKAFLEKGDAAGAKKELLWVVERAGRMKDEAVRILDSLR
jgi:tetratricopeptide (TPR) repeat protein